MDTKDSFKCENRLQMVILKRTFQMRLDTNGLFLKIFLIADMDTKGSFFKKTFSNADTDTHTAFYKNDPRKFIFKKHFQKWIQTHKDPF